MAINLPPGRYSIAQLAELSKAVEIIEKAFPSYDVRLEAASGRHETFSMLRPPTESMPSIRERVIAATSSKPASVLEILAEAPGLEEKKIRGVLCAPDLDFTKERNGGIVRYRYVGTKVRIRSKSE